MSGSRIALAVVNILLRTSNPKGGLAQAARPPQRVCSSSPASRQRVVSMASAEQANSDAAIYLTCLYIAHLATTRWYNNRGCHSQAKNVIGGSLEPAGPNCGFYRDGYCFAGPDDGGVHAVCAEVTSLF